MSEKRTQLLVLIVCYRAADLVIDCLRSLEDEIAGIEDGRVIVCENGTGEESVNLLEGAISENGWGEWVSLKVISPNRGFAGGNNAVLREVLQWESVPEFVLLLNSDTIVRPGALMELIHAAESHPQYAIFGPRIEYPDGTPQCTTYRFRDGFSELISAAGTGPVTKLLNKHNGSFPISDSPIEADWISFACVLIRRQVLLDVGVLDDGYYLYFDDLDYCRMAHNAGYRTYYWPAAHVVHLRGQSNPVKSLQLQCKRRPHYFYASRARYFAKFYGRSGLYLANLLWEFGRFVAFLREIVGHKKPHACQREVFDIWTNALNPMKLPPDTTGDSE